MPIFNLAQNNARQLRPKAFKSEKELHKLFEKNLERLLGVRYVATEFTTGDRQRGRIDTLGIDQDGSPTIIEYKKSSRDNVINQGLFYLDWLVDHKGDFAVAVQERLGQEVEIDWSNPRLILVAEEFNEYDKYAVNRIGANIELWVYRLYEDDILQLDAQFVPDAARMKVKPSGERDKVKVEYSLDWHLEGKPENVRELMDELREKIIELSDEGEIVEKANKNYIGYKHGKNFCEVKPQQSGLKMWLDIPPEELADPRGFGRDVTKVGHHGTGDVEVKLNDIADLEYVMTLIKQSFLMTV
jgi:predicted transport protein